MQTVAQAGKYVVAIEDGYGLIYPQARRNTPPSFEPAIVPERIRHFDVIGHNIVDRRIARTVAQMVANWVLVHDTVVTKRCDRNRLDVRARSIFRETVHAELVKPLASIGVLACWVSD